MRRKSPGRDSPLEITLEKKKRRWLIQNEKSHRMKMAVDKKGEVGGEERRQVWEINKNWGDKERSMLRQMAKRKMSPSQTMIASFFLNPPLAVHTRWLRLIAAETIVEILSLVLVPLTVGTLVPATISSGTLRAAISHGRATVSCRRGGLRATKVALLSVVLSCK